MESLKLEKRICTEIEKLLSLTQNYISQDVSVHEIAASEMAAEMGDIRSTNMIMLGSFLKGSKMVQPETVLKIIEETFGKKSSKVMERNKEALWTGYRYFS